METLDLTKIRAALEEELASIDRGLSEYGASEGDQGVELGVDEGFADSAQATAGRSEILSLVEQMQGVRQEVVAALQRMDEGVFGTCEHCGNRIAPERLEAIPTTRLCMTCKQGR